MWISQAWAQSGEASGGLFGGGLGGMLPIVLIFVVFYFLLIRPQQKRAKEHKATIGTLRRGDKVITGGGIIGTVTKVVDDNELLVEISSDVKVRIARSTITQVISKSEPASSGKGSK